ncbi:MAG: GH116 family glycosyl-hydrolase, partial [Rhodopirellula sp. JB044]|uniref:GH116 family glycosyl-hydrolase n=1 Tax=Rhodopirellula sp. JB044 TaxID=3342844 RepID=UPI00370AA426
MNPNQTCCQPNEDDCGCEQSFVGIDVTRRRFLVAAGALTAGLSGRPLFADGAEDAKDAYASLLKSDPSLRGYWRLDGNLSDSLGKAPGKGGGAASYVDGVVDGKAICLVPKEPVSVTNTDHLRGRSATIELFFKLNSAPVGDEDPVIIAQTSGQQAHYIVGIKNDLSALLYQNVNGDVLTTVNPPTDQPFEVGRWYHLAITSYDLDVRAYLDGYECSLIGGAFEFTRRGPKKSTMTLGTTTVDGWGSTDLCLDEVACYAKGLTRAEIQTHLKAAGWEDRLKTTGERVARVRAERNARRARKEQSILSDPALTAPGTTRVYQGENLDAISFMVGGIGAGAIQFNGKAEPAIWQIACNFHEVRIDDSFLAVRAQSDDGGSVTRALQTEPVGPFAAMASLKFEGEYPIGKYRFEDSALPVELQLEVFNPFIPMDLKSSAIPCAIYQITAINNSSSPVQVDVLAAQQNALGYSEGKGGKFGNNRNEVLSENGATLLHMTRPGIDHSDMVLMTNAEHASGCANWDSLEELHGTFNADGKCDGSEKSKISPAGKTIN